MQLSTYCRESESQYYHDNMPTTGNSITEEVGGAKDETSEKTALIIGVCKCVCVLVVVDVFLCDKCIDVALIC